MPTIVNPCDLSPTFGNTAVAAVTTIASNAQTCLALDNGVAHGTTSLIDLYHDAATVANDFVYEIDFNAQNSTPAKKTFVSEQVQVGVNTATSEMGIYLVNTINAGSLQNNIKVGNNLGQYRGTQKNTTPPAGFIGETARSALGVGSAIGLTTNTATDILTISLTAGIWNVSGLVQFTNAPTGTYASGSISIVSATEGTAGDNMMTTPTMPTAAARMGLMVPPYQLVLSGTTTVYLVAKCVFSGGTAAAYGRISATRVG
jgi:hypothetical protein